MVKQPAWAAATSSSGLVPIPSSNRELNEYCVLFRTVLPVVSVPFPSFPHPCQLALALRVNFMGVGYLKILCCFY
jgi:hypothetical protein